MTISMKSGLVCPLPYYQKALKCCNLTILRAGMYFSSFLSFTRVFSIPQFLFYSLRLFCHIFIKLFALNLSSLNGKINFSVNAIKIIIFGCITQYHCLALWGEWHHLIEGPACSPSCCSLHSLVLCIILTNCDVNGVS